MEENKKRWKKQDLLMYTANAFKFALDWKLNSNESSKKMFGYMKMRIKSLTKLPVKDINEIICGVDIAKEPIRHIYNQLEEWI